MLSASSPNPAANLLAPAKLWSRSEVLHGPCPVPRSPGVYAWFFSDLEDLVPTGECLHHQGLSLLYVGIAPRPDPTNGRPPSTQKLWNRVRYHYRGNAEGSTLRLTLGCLLLERLRIELRRVGSGQRMTFGKEGESRLSSWMEEHAFVAWIESEKPWLVEAELIARTPLPLNLDQNRSHAFHSQLSQLRRTAKARARLLPVV